MKFLAMVVALAMIAGSAFAEGNGDSASDRGHSPPGDPGLSHGKSDPAGVEAPGSQTGQDNRDPKGGAHVDVRG